MDWADKLLYPQAVADIRVVGRMVALMMDKLVTENGALYSDIWCIGHSLGAHTCGFAGRNTRHKIGRISGAGCVNDVIIVSSLQCAALLSYKRIVLSAI